MTFLRRLLRLAAPLVLILGLGAGSASGVIPPTHEAHFEPPLPALTVLTPFRPPPTRYGSGHRGVDLAAAEGDVVRAIGPGIVIYAGLLAGRGVVSVEHEGGLRSTYEPVLAAVHAGQYVSTGTVLGELQAGHETCAPADCLHLGARMPDRVYLDPMALFGPWRIRLKPWDAAVT